MGPDSKAKASGKPVAPGTNGSSPVPATPAKITDPVIAAASTPAPTVLNPQPTVAAMAAQQFLAGGTRTPTNDNPTGAAGTSKRPLTVMRYLGG